jgi:hypothetical protein
MNLTLGLLRRRSLVRSSCDGHETTGSVVSPPAIATLYALKLTPGSVLLKSVFHFTSCFDTVDAIGKRPLGWKKSLSAS